MIFALGCDGNRCFFNGEYFLFISNFVIVFYSKMRHRRKWIGLYTGKIFSNARQVDIDHVVPLKEAHISGASGWTKEKKRQFANDEDNLLAVSKSANRSKGAKDPAKWMPKNEAFHCEYIKKWVAVKEKYILYMDRKEQQKVNRVLEGC